MSKAIYKFSLDYGRSGELYGIFIQDKEYVDLFYRHNGKLYFGEVLGKHSEVICNTADCNLEIVTEDQEAINIFEKYNMTIGYNPFDYFYIDDIPFDEYIEEKEKEND